MLNFFLYMWCVGVIISRWSFYTISFSPTATWRANTCTKLWSAQAVIPSKSFSFLFFIPTNYILLMHCRFTKERACKLTDLFFRLSDTDFRKLFLQDIQLIRQLLNSIVAKYQNFSLPLKLPIHHSLWPWQLIKLFFFDNL